MSKCKGCEAEIVWKTTQGGKAVPLDPPKKGYILIGGGVAKLTDYYTSHFVTCPKADDFRKKKE